LGNRSACINVGTNVGQGAVTHVSQRKCVLLELNQRVSLTKEMI